MLSQSESNGSIMMNRPEIKLPYILTTPEGFDPAKESLPMIVFLHGAGERGDGSNIEVVKVHAIPKLFCPNPDYLGLRVITLSPQCPNGMVWNNLPREVMALVEEKVKELNVDRKRITLTGISMGGFGTWEIGALYNGYFAALAPVCGGSMGANADKYGKTPIWAFHGEDDGCVSCWNSKLMVDAVNKNGGNAKLTTYPGVGHGSWVNAYEQDELIPWIAAQSL